MTSAADEPAAVLAEVRRLRDRTRARAHAGVWLPAAILAALVLSSIVLYRYPFERPHAMEVQVPYWAGLPDVQRDPVLSYLYWFAGSVLAFGSIAVWYRRRERRTGLRVHWRRFVAVSIVALLAIALVAAVPLPLPQDVPLNSFTEPMSTWERALRGLVTPLVPIGAAIVALGVAERSRVLAAAGGWMVFLTWLHCTFGVLIVPSVATRMVQGGGGEYMASPLDTAPGLVVIAMSLPLVLFAAVRAWRSGGASGD